MRNFFILLDNITFQKKVMLIYDLSTLFVCRSCSLTTQKTQNKLSQLMIKNKKHDPELCHSLELVNIYLLNILKIFKLNSIKELFQCEFCKMQYLDR